MLSRTPDAAEATSFGRLRRVWMRRCPSRKRRAIQCASVRSWATSPCEPAGAMRPVSGKQANIRMHAISHTVSTSSAPNLETAIRCRRTRAANNPAQSHDDAFRIEQPGNIDVRTGMQRPQPLPVRSSAETTTMGVSLCRRKSASMSRGGAPFTRVENDPIRRRVPAIVVWPTEVDRLAGSLVAATHRREAGAGS